MAEKYDKNGYNSSDFKRNSNQDVNTDLDHEQDGEEGVKLNDRAGEYMRELLSEKIKLNHSKCPISCKLIDGEVLKLQTTGRVPSRDGKYLDVYREKPAKVTVKVLVPVKEHPKFNFVGKLLGPKGNTMKHLQDETMCKMAVLGRGSMRDRQKEEELRNSLDPKYSHLADELHVEITALAPPAEAHARIAYALAEVKKYLVPDTEEMMWQPPPMRSMERVHPMPQGRPSGPPRAQRMPPAAHAHPHAHGHAPHAHAHAPMQRGMPNKTKVISILDRARSAMESSYNYDDPYAAAPEPPIRGPPRGAPDQEFYYDRPHERYFEDETYYKEDPQPRDFKASARDVGTRRPQHQHQQPGQRHYRAAPYARPPK